MPQRPSVTLLRALVANELPFVVATRKYLGELIVACYHDRPEAISYAERLTTASAELLENALKYSPPGTDLVVRLTRTPSELRLQIGNALRDEGRTVLASIRREIGAVWAEHDAREVFRKKVMASLADPKAKAMLGYAKIRMETGGRLRAHLGSRGRLDVTLTFPLEPPAPALR
jgi:hypothetical protein